ncbi:MAG: ABC transporter substrate-binding protein [Deltaproteobacteria bacterium]|jgi:branched-chain amino acid transport system substrate-binding protein|nr:ABC transporter substrate-binding protein [Deltaproteobacteria bacterium]MBT4641737.1 ABC transporter substrate-binding protein [Deltaproteobacteria bacterium]MBT6502077.1 ABC transporter substrate-binding protein [Deltaproteobacteria bacterium]MBT7151539.1 ABC transporter substrate-binding protein [Deltaproteobacteria bacterium]MBT7713650.1 ABC transporter substrate-binding protein [Deltaproteobacteria bacterium]
MKKRFFMLGLIQIVLLGWIVSSVYAGNVRGVTDKEIKLACLVDFSGPGKFSGKMLAMGAKSYVDYVNSQGGIHGRKIKLVTIDNGYMPNTTRAAAQKAIFKDDVFAIGFNLGSTGSAAIIPLLDENEVVLMPHGANKKFYNPGHKWVFVPYSTQFNMGSRALEFIVRERNAKARIGIIYQDDAFGREGLQGVEAAAKFLNVKILKAAPYKMGTVDLSAQMRMMKEANVDWIIAWTLIPQTGAIMKKKAEMKWDVNVLGNNTTAYRVIFPMLGKLADGYMAVTPIVPWQDIPPSLRNILMEQKLYGPLDKTPFPTLFLSIWAYYAAMAEGLRLAGPDLTPQTFLAGLEKVKDLDVDGICPNITFTPNRHVGYFSSMVVKAFAKDKQFEVISPMKSPVTPQD